MGINNIKNEFDLDTLKLINPKEWFHEVLLDDEFGKLDILNKESRGMISWDVLGEDGVCEIENGRITGITWNEDLDLEGTQVTSLRKIKEIKGKLELFGTDIIDLGDLVKVGSDFNIEYTQLRNLGKLREVGGDLWITSKYINSLGNIERIGGYLNLQLSNIELQLNVLEGKLNGTLKFNCEIVLIDRIEDYIINKRLDFDKLEKDFGNDINKINDNNFRKIFEGLIKIEYRRELKNIIENLKNIHDEKVIIGLNDKVKKMKEKITKIGINIDEIIVN